MYFAFKCIVCAKGCQLSTIEQKIDRDIFCQECLNKYKDYSEKPLVPIKIKCDTCQDNAVFQGGDRNRSKALQCKRCFLRLWIFDKGEENYFNNPHIIIFKADGFNGWSWSSELVRKFFINGQDMEKTLNDAVIKETNDIMKQFENSST